MMKKKLNDKTEIPLMGLGTWELEGRGCQKTVEQSLKIGYRHIDTATAYKNEEAVSEAISSFPRKDLFLTTKLWFDVQDPKQVEKACDLSLQKLKTSYVDLYLLHWPNKKTFLDLLFAMQKLVEKGKIRSMGICNATIHHLQDILDQKLKISMNQVEFHPFLNQQKLLDFCNQHQIAITAYCPLARGAVLKNKELQKIGATHHKTASQIALRWLIQKGIVAIPKGSSEPHLRENFDIFNFMLSEKEMALIDSLNRNERLVVLDWSEFDY
jgi:2,5-diketo-D-gluconate reductase B